MLPQPSATFTLPSLYDDLELDCRLYFPKLRTGTGEAQFAGFAVFAHPYAPLGGCYDDPVVHTVGAVLVGHGYAVGTFNFRGAEHSAGKTSWSGKGELGDYVSMYVLALSFLNAEGVSDHLRQGGWEHKAGTPTLIIGGYSYGSMIAAHVPAIETITSIMQRASEGSAEGEITHRAHDLAKAFLGYCETEQTRGRSSLKTTVALSPARATFGGYESPTAAQRIGREGSRHSIDAERVRQSVDKVRRKLGNRQASQTIQAAGRGDEDVQDLTVMPRLAYLLISPLLGPVSSFATMFSRLKFERKDRRATAARDARVTDTDMLLSQNPSLVVFGTKDHFTSSTKVREWCELLKSQPGSRLTFREVLAAGHFWHQQALETQMTGAVVGWLDAMAATLEPQLATTP